MSGVEWWLEIKNLEAGKMGWVLRTVLSLTRRNCRSQVAVSRSSTMAAHGPILSLKATFEVLDTDTAPHMHTVTTHNGERANICFKPE